MGRSKESLVPGGRNDHTTDNFQEWLRTEEGQRELLRLRTSRDLGTNAVNNVIGADEYPGSTHEGNS